MAGFFRTLLLSVHISGQLLLNLDTEPVFARTYHHTRQIHNMREPRHHAEIRHRSLTDLNVQDATGRRILKMPEVDKLDIWRIIFPCQRGVYKTNSSGLAL